MIGKKVTNSKGGSSKATRIGALLDYIRAPERDLSDEKCAYYGARGFLTDSPSGHRAEMVALAQDAVRSADPINHYILSWREGEVPLPAQIEEAVTLFMSELGLQGHQVVYGLHSDTDNLHLHVVVNRVHPDTLRVVKINGGFDIEAVHRAVARIEHEQGWMPEVRSRYRIDEAGDVVRTSGEHRESQSPSQDKCDREVRSGQQSAERIAIDEAGPIIANATSWEDLHAALANKGMRYERVGSGAKVFVGDIAVKASRVAREASFSRIQKRLGDYRPAPKGLPIKSVDARPLQPDLPGWEPYVRERAKYNAARSASWLQMRRTATEDRSALLDRQRARRHEIFSGACFRRRSALLNTLRGALADEQRDESRLLRQAHAVARSQLREQYGHFPSLEQWLRDQGQTSAAEQWRYRESASYATARPAQLAEQAPASTIAGYLAHWEARQDARQQAVSAAWKQYGRDVERLKDASKLRWDIVRLLAKGPIAGKLWALDARLAHQREWRPLHQRHRDAVRTAHHAPEPLDWASWVQEVVGKSQEIGQAAKREPARESEQRHESSPRKNRRGRSR